MARRRTPPERSPNSAPEQRARAQLERLGVERATLDQADIIRGTPGRECAGALSFRSLIGGREVEAEHGSPPWTTALGERQVRIVHERLAPDRERQLHGARAVCPGGRGRVHELLVVRRADRLDRLAVVQDEGVPIDEAPDPQPSARVRVHHRAAGPHGPTRTRSGGPVRKRSPLPDRPPARARHERGLVLVAARTGRGVAPGTPHSEPVPGFGASLPRPACRRHRPDPEPG